MPYPSPAHPSSDRAYRGTVHRATGGRPRLRRWARFAGVVGALGVLAAVVVSRYPEAVEKVAPLDRVATEARLLVDGGGASTADGYVEPGGSVAPTDGVPAITRLDPQLRDAIQDAAQAAAADGITLRVNSGWRSARYQQQLLDEAVRTYGSAAEAARFVLPPERSEHVHGRAVDVGPTDAAYWVIQHGARFGLCQTYANEAWHFELATEPGGVCPAPSADPAAG